MHAAVRSLIGAAPETSADVTILDTEASPEHLSRGTARHADLLVCVVEPYYKSLETGRRMALLGRDLGLQVTLLANKVRDGEDEAAVREFARSHDLDVAGVIPWDERFPRAEKQGQAPLDFAPDSPAVAAIGAVAELLVSGAGASAVGTGGG